MRFWLMLRAAMAAALLVAAGVRPVATASDPLAVYQLGRGWATFGLALPPGAARGEVLVGSLPTQTDVKTTWPDGSIRFAVVTAQPSKAGSYPITAASSQVRPVAARSTRWPSVSAEFVIAGETWTAAVPGAVMEVWLDGPLVTEGRALVAPARNGFTHPFLRVIFDTRVYADGTSRLDVTVENTLDTAAADAVTYDVTISSPGQPAFRRTGVEHKYLTRWRRVLSHGLSEASVVPDFRPFVAARALPAYLQSVAAPARSVDGAQFDILQTGDLTVPMNAHGGRPEIAPYPDWIAQYLVHKRDDQRQYMLRHGELAGSWGIHIKEGEGGWLVSIDRRPNFWLDTRGEDGDRPANDMRGAGPAGDNAHQPSLAFVPYLVTGDRFFLDEMKYWANFSLLWTFQDSYSNQRGGSRGLLAYNEVRGIGWALRTLADTAAYVPDTDSMGPYFREKVINNLQWLDEYAARTQTPFGTLFPNRRPEDEQWSPYSWLALWEHTYLAWAIDRAEQHGFRPGSSVRDRIVALQLRLFNSASEGFPRAFAGAYVLAVGIRQGQQVNYFRSLGEIFNITQKFGNARPFEGYYGPEARLMLLIAKRQRLPGAEEAYQFLMGHSEEGVSMTEDLIRRSGWAIAE
jgi:hypothetical protein